MDMILESMIAAPLTFLCLYPPLGSHTKLGCCLGRKSWQAG
uniref:Uncharacterized protein n=1 Tax=Rhizophora mucronata TaxID=61149 RepID=A0A2P2QNK5_RHIMU